MRGTPMEAGKGKSRDFRLSEAPRFPGGQEGVLRSSRNPFRVNAQSWICDWSASIPY